MRRARPCCDLGPGEGPPSGDWPLTPFRDAFGFTTRLCPRHYENLVRVLARADGVTRAADYAGAGPPPPQRPTGHPRQGEARATGEEQRRARLASGWSLRELARALDRSYSQVQAAEYGKRPVDPVVAAWVRTVLD